MQAQKTKDTDPEIRLRSAMHRRGLRYRLHRALLDGTRRTVDVAFPTEQLAVDVHGCFWHGCPKHFVPPKANAEFWARKIEANRQRDSRTSGMLADIGWEYIVVWEHEDMESAAGRVENAVRARRSHS